MTNKDYYNTLGISKDTSKEDIKKAYKRLAKKYHPDINKDPSATEKFKEINEAAAVLGDDKKRANYDRYGTAEEAFGGGGYDYRGGSGDFDFGDIFDQFFGGGGMFGGNRRQQKAGPKRGSDLRFEMEITLHEAAFGIEKEVTIPKLETCDLCKGKGAEKESDIETCSTCAGSGMQTRQQRTPFGVFQTQTVCRACSGNGRHIKNHCSKCDGEGRVDVTKNVKINIPGGVDTGTRVRITGEGEAGEKGGPSGDLYVEIHVRDHQIFERHDDDLYMEIPISFTQAALGDEIDIPTLEGRSSLKIPSGTQTETIFRIRGKGIKHLRNSGRGDQMIKVSIQVPNKLNTKQKELLKEFEKITGKANKSFFDKIKDMF